MQRHSLTTIAHLAHSARPEQGIEAQPYSEHVLAVRRGAKARMDAALRYSSTNRTYLSGYAEQAGFWHDLGKLEEENQRVLRGEVRSRKLPVNHVDAGVAVLLSRRLAEAATAVYSHHSGLCDFAEEQAKQQLSKVDPSYAALRDPEVKLRTDARITELASLHLSLTGEDADVTTSGCVEKLSGFSRRLLLSCLVDADHGDTARHWGEERETGRIHGRWGERLASLDRYVSRLGASDARSEERRRIYKECRDSPARAALVSCESPVGSGKTTAVMAYLLRVAEERDLRHLFVVLPYTNIIDQAVEVYRKALVLEGEDPEQVVAAHHHQAEFNSWEARHLTTLWRAPVIVTTAVQFFETLAAAATPALRKLHELPGSAVFVDEAHAAMRIELWPYMWRQLKELGEAWSCRFVLGSGSLVRFWEIERIMGGSPERIPALAGAEEMKRAEAQERERIRYRTYEKSLNLEQLCDLIAAQHGPRVVVMNTVHSAAVVAQKLRQGGQRVEHLSTALAPEDRRRILSRVRRALEQQPECEMILAATSCVEAGMDLSFRTGFRERSRAASLIQLGGRVNRHGERGACTVWDFVAGDERLKSHPEFTHSRPIVEEMFRSGKWETPPGDAATYALVEEFKRAAQDDLIENLLTAERCNRYPTVAKMARLIKSDTRLVVVDEGLADRLRRGMATAREIRSGSVQLWSYQIHSLALEEIIPESGIYRWGYNYDKEFLGVMKGILGLKEIDSAGCAIL